MGDEPVDILVNLPKRSRPEVLGIWRRENIVDGIKHVTYERPSNDVFGDLLGWFVPPNFRFVFDYLGVGLEVRRMVLSRTDMSINSKIVLTIPNFQCPDCGSHTELRILAGGEVDTSNPNLPKILFGNWDKTFYVDKARTFQMLDEAETKIERLKIDNEKLRPMERENTMLQDHMVEMEKLNDLLEEGLTEKTRECDRLFAERAVIMRFLDTKGITMDKVMKAKAAGEALASADQMVDYKKQMIEDKEKRLKDLDDIQKKTSEELSELRVSKERLRKKRGKNRRAKVEETEYDE